MNHTNHSKALIPQEVKWKSPFYGIIIHTYTHTHTHIHTHTLSLSLSFMFSLKMDSKSPKYIAINS